MAVVLDINILSNKMLDLNKSVSFLARYNISIESINSIDNWMWDNEKKIEDTRQIATILDLKHIVAIKLKESSIKDIGVYIEKIDNQFLYTLWINTHGYTMLDCEKITMENSEFYKKVIQALLEYNRLIEDSFEVVGIVMGIIQKSKNMMIWMLNKHHNLNIELEKYKGYMIEDMYVLQRK